MREVRLLVELGLVQSEGVDDVNHGLGLVLGIVSRVLGGSVGSNVDVANANADLLAVGLVDDIVDQLDVVGVGDELITSDDVLAEEYC